MLEQVKAFTVSMGKRQCSPNDRQELEKLSGGAPLSSVARSIIESVDPDRIEETAKTNFNTDTPTQKQLKEAAVQLANSAVEVLATKLGFRKKLVDLKKSFEQTIDTVSRDRVTAARETFWYGVRTETVEHSSSL